MDLIREKKVFDTSKDGVRIRAVMNYPLTAGKTKAEKRINAFIGRVADEYKKSADGRSGYFYSKLTYRICDTDPLSVLFFSEKRGEGVYAFTPFSVTFDRCGHAVPFLPDKALKKKIKQFFASHGIKISSRQIRYSYYSEEGKCAVYARTGAKRAGPDLLIYSTCVPAASAYGRPSP